MKLPSSPCRGFACKARVCEDHGRRRIRLWAAVCLLLAITGPTLFADVFQRWKNADQAARTLEHAGGTVCYKAPVTVNGASGQLTAFGFDQDFDTLIPELRRRFGETTEDQPPQGLWVHVYRSGDAVRQLVATTTGDRQCVVFLIEQSAADYETAQRADSQRWMPGLPPCPGATPQFNARDARSGMSLQLAAAQDLPATVLESYAAALAAEGWKDTACAAGSPGRTAAAPKGSLRLFSCRDELLCVYAESGGTPGVTQITVLHKTRKID